MDSKTHFLIQMFGFLQLFVLQIDTGSKNVANCEDNPAETPGHQNMGHLRMKLIDFQSFDHAISLSKLPAFEPYFYFLSAIILWKVTALWPKRLGLDWQDKLWYLHKHAFASREFSTVHSQKLVFNAGITRVIGNPSLAKNDKCEGYCGLWLLKVGKHQSTVSIYFCTKSFV